MNRRIRDLWTAKLREPGMVQAEGALRKGDAFCCLGVLCELFREDTGKGEWRGGDWGENMAFHPNGDSEATVLPPAVVEWAGLDDVMYSGRGYGRNPTLMASKDPEDKSAAHLNDSGVSFVEIADLIEASL